MVIHANAINADFDRKKILIPMGRRWYVYGHTTVDASGNKSPIFPIRKKISNWRSRSHIYTSMVAEDGSELVYGIPLDLDFESADKKWTSRGKLNYKAIKAFLDETYPILGRYLCTYTRSTRGRGLGLILFVDPFLRDHEKTGAVNRLADRVQKLLVFVLNYHGLGCDESARGVTRFTPNWRNKRILLHKDDITIRRVQRDNEPHQVLRSVYNELRRSEALKLPTRKDAVKSGQRFAVKDEADQGLAKVYAHILNSEPESLQLSTSFEELSAISDLSIPTLRKYLKKAAWIEVSSSYALGLKVRLLPNPELSERAYSEPKPSLSFRSIPSSHEDWNLPEPEDVGDGDRNNYIWRKAVLLRNEGYSLDEAITLIRALVSRIPEARESRNCRKLESITASIYRHDRRQQKAKSKIFSLEAFPKEESSCPDLARNDEAAEKEVGPSAPLKVAVIPVPSLNENKNNPVKKGGQGDLPPGAQTVAQPKNSDREEDFHSWLLAIIPNTAGKILKFESKSETKAAVKMETIIGHASSKPLRACAPKPKRRLSLRERRKAECREIHPLDRFERAFLRCKKSDAQIIEMLHREHHVITRSKKSGRMYRAPDGPFKRLCEAFSYLSESLRIELLRDFLIKE